MHRATLEGYYLEGNIATYVSEIFNDAAIPAGQMFIFKVQRPYIIGTGVEVENIKYDIIVNQIVSKNNSQIINLSNRVKINRNINRKSSNRNKS